MNKKRLFLVIIPLVLLILGIGIYLFIQHKNMPSTEAGIATGESALAALTDICGESRVEELADISKAKGDPSPEQYLTQNSTYTLDDEAIEIYVESYITAAESTAQAKSVSVQTLIVEEWGYESIDAYRAEAKELVLDFIKQRLAIYEAAKELDVSIVQSEYESKLSVYALNFGYSTAEEFIYACTPASIANEMLYDKVLGILQE